MRIGRSVVQKFVNNGWVDITKTMSKEKAQEVLKKKQARPSFHSYRLKTH